MWQRSGQCNAAVCALLGALCLVFGCVTDALLTAALCLHCDRRFGVLSQAVGHCITPHSDATAGCCSLLLLLLAAVVCPLRLTWLLAKDADRRYHQAPMHGRPTAPCGPLRKPD